MRLYPAFQDYFRKAKPPLLAIWGKNDPFFIPAGAEGGPLDTFYAKDGGPLGIWRQWAPRAQGQPMKGGHFFPEENPNDTAALINQFLAA